VINPVLLIAIFLITAGLLCLIGVVLIYKKFFCIHLWQEGKRELLKQEVKNSYEGKYAKRVMVTYFGVKEKCVKCNKEHWVKQKEEKDMTC
jgi:hypothetical protein